jgi:hypothetical protein
VRSPRALWEAPRLRSQLALSIFGARPDSLRLFRLGYALDALDSVYFEYTEQALLVATLGDPVHDEPELQCPEVDQSAEVDQSCHMSGTVSVTCQGRDIGPFPAVVMYT